MSTNRDIMRKSEYSSPTERMAFLASQYNTGADAYAGIYGIGIDQYRSVVKIKERVMGGEISGTPYELQIFKSEEFGEVRTVTINNEPWFVGKDVTVALGYVDTKQAIRVNVADEDKKHLPKRAFGGCTSTTSEINNNGAIVINESGLYALIFGSKLESARRFKHWVTSEVLPAIRKHGGYMAGQENMSDDELLAKALMVAQSKIEENKKQIEEMKPHAVLGKAITTANTSILVGDLAKILKQNGIEIGAKRLFQWMRENGYLIKRKGTDWNLPTQRSMEQNLFEIKESVHIDGNGCNRITRTPKITGKGQEYFINKFLI